MMERAYCNDLRIKPLPQGKFDYEFKPTAERINTDNMHYEPHLGYTMIERLGVDFLHMAAIELSKLTDLPSSPMPEVYGHKHYVSTNWGTCANGYVQLDLIFSRKREDGRTCQEVESFGVPFYEDLPPRNTLMHFGDTWAESVKEYVFGATKDGWRDKVNIRGKGVFKPLVLMYVTNPMTEERLGLITFREVKNMAEAVAGDIFRRYFNFKPVERQSV